MKKVDGNILSDLIGNLQQVGAIWSGEANYPQFETLVRLVFIYKRKMFPHPLIR